MSPFEVLVTVIVAVGLLRVFSLYGPTKSEPPRRYPPATLDPEDEPGWRRDGS